MDLKQTAIPHLQEPVMSYDAVLDSVGPHADGDPMGTPAADERVLWKGRPSLPFLARTAFHTRSVAVYFIALIGISLAYGNTDAALVCAGLGVAGLSLLQLLAWLSMRSTLYILTDTRLIIRKGIAIEARINIPLKHITTAQLKQRSNGHGDIALELAGERLLAYLLMWPHVRPWRFAHPQPMLRAIPEAEKVAKMLADACAQFSPIERNLDAVSVAGPAPDHQVKNQTGKAAGQHRPAAPALADKGFEGAPA
jgi:hypothetical protein